MVKGSLEMGGLGFKAWLLPFVKKCGFVYKPHALIIMRVYLNMDKVVSSAMIHPDL